MESNCIFCKIVKGEIPCYKVYEDNLFLGFLDITPRSKGHTLLIPKNHHRWVYDVPEFVEYWQAVQTITKAMQKSLSPTFVTYMTYGLDVPHAHIHILPRFGDEPVFPQAKSFSTEELQSIAKLINSAV